MKGLFRQLNRLIAAIGTGGRRFRIDSVRIEVGEDLLDCLSILDAGGNPHRPSTGRKVSMSMRNICFRRCAQTAKVCYWRDVTLNYAA